MSSLTSRFHWHRYWLHHSAGANQYYECRCRDRRVRQSRYGHSPIDDWWLAGNDTRKPIPKPPAGPGGCSPLATVTAITARWQYKSGERPTIKAGELSTLLAMTGPDEPVYVEINGAALNIVRIEHPEGLTMVLLQTDG